jgi:hypothetical protein
MQVTFNLVPTVNSITNQELCNGNSTTPITFTGVLPGTVYNWTNNAPSIGLAASGVGNITSFIATNNGTAPVVATITVTPSYTNSGGVICTGSSKSFTITVDPTPTITSTASATICNNTGVGYTITSETTGTTFTWTASILTTPVGGTITGFTNCNSSCGASINPTLNNTGTSPGVVRYIITPTGPGSTNCPGIPFNFDVTVNPTFTVIATPSAQTICNGTATNIALSTNITGPTVTYSWTASLTTGTASGFSSGSGISIVQTLTNNSTSQATVTYHITPAIGTCTGTPIDVLITIYPSGQVNQPGNQVVCNTASTAAVNFTTNNIFGITTYSWTNSQPSIGLSASGSGNISSFTATNGGTSPVIATIIVTPTLTNGGTSCVGPTKTFTITVNPTGQVNQPANQEVCNTNLTTVSFTTNNSGGSTTYAWTNDNTTIGLGSSGNGNISFNAVNLTT